MNTEVLQKFKTMTTSDSNYGLRGASPIRNQMDCAGQMNTSTEKRMPAVKSSLGSLEREIAVLTESLSELAARLKPVLRIEPCDQQCKKDIPNPPALTVYDTIQQQSDRVSKLNHGVRNVLNLLEV